MADQPMAAYSPYTAPPRVRPSAWWYLLVAGLWLLALALFISIGVTFVRVIDDGITAVPRSGTIVLPSDGLTVYASVRPSDKSCSVTSPAGLTTPLNTLDFTLTATWHGQEVHALATTPSQLSGGSYRLSCPGVPATATLWTGDRLPITSVVVRAIVAGLSGILGLALLVLLLVRRHLSKTRNRSAQLAGYPTPGYPTGAGAPGWPSQQPYGGAPYGQAAPPEVTHGQMGPPTYGHQPPPAEQQPPYDQGRPPDERRGDPRA